MRFKIDWASLIFGKEFTVILCFTLYFVGGTLWGGGGEGAYIWWGLNIEELIFGTCCDSCSKTALIEVGCFFLSRFGISVIMITYVTTVFPSDSWSACAVIVVIFVPGHTS